jgi:glycosyltransferase involved in cell wall biosynthesis
MSHQQTTISGRLAVPLLRPVAMPQSRPAFLVPRYVNIICASLARGGAERQIVDLVEAWNAAGHRCKVIVFGDHKPAFDLQSGKAATVVRLHGIDRSERARAAAQEVIASPQMFAYTFLIREADLRELWRYGIATAPVIVNAQPAWQNAPQIYNDPHVPFVVAVSAHVAGELRAAGFTQPIEVIRHEVRRSLSFSAEARARIRAELGVSDDCLLIGMVGQFKAQKAYPRAVRVLKHVQHARRAKLMIVGGWDHAYGFSSATHAATMRLAAQLECGGDILLPGNVEDPTPYYNAFDVFLNTSLYEGLSIATLEAQAHGCPIVTADAGGQRECLREGDVLVGPTEDDSAYAAAILRATRRPSPPASERPIVPHLWQYLAHAADIRPQAQRALFLTANLNIGGAQRSLVNLVTRLGPDAYVGVLNHLTFDGFHRALREADVPAFFFGLGQSIENRTFEVLSFLRNARIGQLVFWNVDAPTKLLLTKALSPTALRIIEVSPGPMLFRELDQTGELQHRIAFDAADYFRRLDRFIAKYHGGAPPQHYGFDSAHVTTVRNGVPLCPGAPPVPLAERGASLITVTRIVPNKQIEKLLAMMQILRGRVSDARLTIVGGVEQRHIGYWESLVARIERDRLDCIDFVGPSTDIRPLLDAHRVFVMISKEQGCPNASLEAMASGLPVVANDDGGTAEQVVHGKTGFVTGHDDPAAMAAWVEKLLIDDAQAQRLGEAGRDRARVTFSMDEMVERYRSVLGLNTSARNSC